MKTLKISILTAALLNLCCVCAFSQKLYDCDYEITTDNLVIVKTIYNNDKEHYINVYIDGADDDSFCGKLDAGSHKTLNKICNRFVKVEVQGAKVITIFDPESVLHKRGDNAYEPQPAAPAEFDGVGKDSFQHVNEESVSSPSKKQRSSRNLSLSREEAVSSFKDKIEDEGFFSCDYFNSLNSKVDFYVGEMQGMDRDTKEKYVRDNHLVLYISDIRDLISKFRYQEDELISDYLDSNFPGKVIIEKQHCIDEMRDILSSKLQEREVAISRLNAAIDDVPKSVLFDKIAACKPKQMYFGVAALLLLVILVVVIKSLRRKASKSPTVIPDDSRQQTAQADIVVRRKTTSILKRQSLEDVLDNPAYMQIDCAEFSYDSAVRRIYFKNTCIMDIYNLYAEDLRNPDSPKEDGCMVLGRWVHDPDVDEYYVSLEEIVKPGDDAVFKEYELNFGGKIKLKVSEKLRKLRRDTNLQYDMTCWVHSHPGLGVFFSNADSSVQMQLKHPTHPKFLIAIVIDILTPQQELGIFTFKHDMSINSKFDLRKMYSLEQMYKWAVISERNRFKAEDHFNLLSSANERRDSCYGLFLSNGAVIDMCQMEVEQPSGLVGWVHGHKYMTGSHCEFVAKAVTKEKQIPDNEAIGCFIIGTHRSIPTIRKFIANADNIQFVLFYSTTDGLLTAIPIVDGQLELKNSYYGEETIEELKIWTRRKR